jgi:hypothetical protein
MRPTGGDGDFERRLERELRLYVASAPRPSPRVGQPAYRAASRRGGQSSLTSGILGKAVAGLVVAVLTVGAGSAVAMAATGSHNPGELAQSIAQRVEGCKDKVGTDNHDKSTGAEVAASSGGNSRGTGQCVGSEVNQNSEAHQQKNGVTDRVERKAAHPSTSPGTHQDHGQGSGAGSVGAPGQGGTGHGNGDGGQGDNGDSDNHGDSGNHGHQPTPSPHS